MEDKKPYEVGRATLALALGALGSRGVGFLREVVVAARFGTGRAFDLYVAGSAFPTFLSTIFLYALPDYLVPYFSRLKEGRQAALRKFLLATLLVGLAFLGLLYFAAPFLVRLFSPGIPGAEIPFGVRAFQILLLFIFGTALEAVLRSYYQVEGRFGLTVFSPLLSGLVVLASVFFFSGKFSVYALAWGWAIGSLLSVGVMLVFLLMGKKETAASPVADLSPASFKNFSLILLLAVLGQLLHLLDRFFGSFLPPAALSAFYFASLPVLFPVGILVYPLGYAIFPKLAQMLSEGKNEEASQLLAKTLGWANFVLIPVMVVLLLAPQEVVRLVFQRGVFDASSTGLTSGCLRLFALSLLALSYVFVLTRIYLACGQGKRLVLFSLFTLFTRVVLAWLGIKWWGLLGLAGAGSLALIFSALLLGLFLPRSLRGGVAKPIGRASFKLAALSLLAFGGGRWLSGLLVPAATATYAALLFGFFSIFFLAGCFVLKVAELQEGLDFLHRAKVKWSIWAQRNRSLAI